jgi:hypothetical protein
MESEKELQNALLKSLLRLPCIVGKQIETEVPIPYKHIYIPATLSVPSPTIEVWCFKQDIAIYDILYDKKVTYNGAKITFKMQDVLDVTLEKDSAQNTKHIGLPYVIIETKKGQPITDTLLAYSKKAEMIKTIFPYCKYLLVVFGKISPRTYRHGLNFDGIYEINTSKDLVRFGSIVCSMISRSEDEAKRLIPPKKAGIKQKKRIS